MTPLIEIENLRYAYPNSNEQGRWVLDGVSLSIQDGEFVSIVGANGSGKTTLIRHMNGSLLPVEGRVCIDSLDSREKNNIRLIRQKVGMVFQFPEDQVISTTVEDDVAFGLENLGVPGQEIRQRVESVLSLMGLWEERQRTPHMLSAGQIQRLALAGVLAMQPRCILFDEATTMLDPQGRKTVLKQMERLHEEGVSIVFITHSMDEAILANRVIVMHEGKIVCDGTPASIFNENTPLSDYHLKLPRITALATGMRRWFPQIPASTHRIQSLINCLPPWQEQKDVILQPQRDTPLSKERGDVVIDVQSLGHTYLAGTPLEHRALSSSNLKVFCGRSHGFAGATGSGKSTLLQHLNGILRPQEGSVRVMDFLLHEKDISTRDVVRQVGMVFQNPEMQFFETYVGDEIAYGARQFPTQEKLAERVGRAMLQVGLDFEKFKDRPTFSLSGGEKRKGALASALVLAPKILLLDEPMASLDPLAKEEVITSLKKMQSAGTLLVLSSHDMDDMIELAQDLTVFKSGRDYLSGPVERVFSNPQSISEAGLEMPLAAQVATGMRAKNWPIPDITIREDQFMVCLALLMGDGHAAI